MNEPLLDVLRRHKTGELVGVTGVCSAHPLVLQAAVRHALMDGGPLLVEATSNQVDQFGGYTGMQPPQFRDLVLSIADQEGLPRESLVLGGDHLGPNPWRALPPEDAMQRAEELVDAYVRAGFTKIHLDTSLACSGEFAPLPDEVVADRAARLAGVAEQAAGGRQGDLVYVIGTEVPVPGGAHHQIEALTPTSAKAAERTLTAHHESFGRAGLAATWERVIALVVQPGVEFDANNVIDYQHDGTADLRQVAEQSATLIFEAHSTDYQSVNRLAELVEDHWAVLKVGPALTFALREALFALASIEDELIGLEARSNLRAVVEAAMLAEPKWWRGYYDGDDRSQHLGRIYSYSDRIRYYWAVPEVSRHQKQLFDNLRTVDIPLSMLSAYLPNQYARIRESELDKEPAAIVIDRIRDVLRGYWAACTSQGQGLA